MSTYAQPLIHSPLHLAQNRVRPIALLLFALSVASAIAFIARVNHPVFDEGYHLPEVRRYATQPITVASLRQHGVPTGPGSFLWMSVGGRIFGDHLWAYRSMVLLSWLLLGAAIAFIGPHSGQVDAVWFALLIILIFPHTPTAFASLLTEGPSLLFATAGMLLWAEAIWPEEAGVWDICAGHLGALLIGLAVISRQYYMALLPGMACVLAIRFLKAPGLLRARNLSRLSTLVTAALPVLWLLFVWGGPPAPAWPPALPIPVW